MNANKHLVFDWNSTLLDDFPILHESTNCVLAEAGHPPVSLDRFRDSYDIPITRLYQNLGFTDHELDHILNQNSRMFLTAYEQRSSRSRLRDGATEILQKAHAEGVRSYILSNYIVDPIRSQLKRLGIERFFTEVLAYISAATQFRDISKGEMLRRYMADKGMIGERTIIVGDSVEEIQIAHAEGLVSVAITGGGAPEERLRAEKPDHVIHSLHELKPILEERGFVS